MYETSEMAMFSNNTRAISYVGLNLFVDMILMITPLQVLNNCINIYTWEAQ